MPVRVSGSEIACFSNNSPNIGSSLADMLCHELGTAALASGQLGCFRILHSGVGFQFGYLLRTF